jgi:2,4-dienoyl-CoA reductase-like NADH-dependent reductase (Old Yellow Enzyme family)
LIHRVFSPVALGDFHLPHRVLDTPVVSLVAVEPSGMVLPSRIRTPKPSMRA